MLTCCTNTVARYQIFLPGAATMMSILRPPSFVFLLVQGVIKHPDTWHGDCGQPAVLGQPGVVSVMWFPFNVWAKTTCKDGGHSPERLQSVQAKNTSTTLFCSSSIDEFWSNKCFIGLHDIWRQWGLLSISIYIPREQPETLLRTQRFSVQGQHCWNKEVKIVAGLACMT